MGKVKEVIEILLDFLEGKTDTENVLKLYKEYILYDSKKEELILINKYISCLCEESLETSSETMYDEIENYLICLLKYNLTYYLSENHKEDLINEIDFTFIDVKEIRDLINSFG